MADRPQRRSGTPAIVATATRGPAMFFDPDYLAANPPAERVVPKAERTSREVLIAITNSYFDGLTTHDGSIINARMRNRVENSRGHDRSGLMVAPEESAEPRRLHIGIDEF